MVEEGNFVSRQRLLSYARGTDILVPFDTLFLGLDWGRVSDQYFTLQSNHEMYSKWEAALFRDAGDPLWFSYPADHPLTAAFEEQATRLVRE